LKIFSITKKDKKMNEDIHTILKSMTINEIEDFFRKEISKNISYVFQNLLKAGRINGNGEQIIQRFEDEAIKILREHWVR